MQRAIAVSFVGYEAGSNWYIIDLKSTWQTVIASIIKLLIAAFTARIAEHKTVEGKN